MSFLNRVLLMGEATHAPEVTKDAEGRPAASFEILIERRFTTPEGQQRSLSTRVPVLAVGEACDASRALRGKREIVLLEGRLLFESWKVDGKWHNQERVIVHRLDLVGPGGLDGASSEPSATSAGTSGTTNAPAGASMIGSALSAVRDTRGDEQRQAPESVPRETSARRGRPSRTTPELSGAARESGR